MKVVGTLLSGNSEDIVSDAVLSVINWVDTLLLIDTGITDGTAKLVESLAGDKYRRIDFAWCDDFALARNSALEHASSVGATWAVTIDTDERLIVDGFDTLDQLRSELARHPNVNSWLVADRERTYAKERLVRVPTRLEWRGRTHEALIGASNDERKLLSGIRFYETPKSPDAFRHKLERDLVILQAETREDPTNARWWYYLGQTLDGLGCTREAADAYMRCESLDGWAEEGAWACYQAAKCLSTLKEYRQALQACTLGLSRQPASPELAWLAGFSSYQLGNLKDAIHWQHIAIALGNVEGTSAGESRVSFRHLPGWYEGPYDVLRFAYHKLGKADCARAAEEKYQHALTLRQSRECTVDSNAPRVNSRLQSKDSSSSSQTVPIGADVKPPRQISPNLHHHSTVGSNGKNVFLDLGAHHGDSLRQFASHLPLDETWEVHAFEPNPACDLASRIAELGLSLQIHNAAVWVRDGTLSFCQQNHVMANCGSPTDGRSDVDGWGSCIEALGSNHPGLLPAIEVPCVDLAHVLAAYSAEDHIVVKMDVEGAEFAILRHLIAEDIINRIDCLYVEWHDRLLVTESVQTREDLEQQLKDFGVEVIRWG